MQPTFNTITLTCNRTLVQQFGNTKNKSQKCFSVEKRKIRLKTEIPKNACIKRIKDKNIQPSLKNLNRSNYCSSKGQGNLSPVRLKRIVSKEHQKNAQNFENKFK